MNRRHFLKSALVATAAVTLTSFAQLTHVILDQNRTFHIENGKPVTEYQVPAEGKEFVLEFTTNQTK